MLCINIVVGFQSQRDERDVGYVNLLLKEVGFQYQVLKVWC